MKHFSGQLVKATQSLPIDVARPRQPLTLPAHPPVIKILSEKFAPSFGFSYFLFSFSVILLLLLSLWWHKNTQRIENEKNSALTWQLLMCENIAKKKTKTKTKVRAKIKNKCQEYWKFVYVYLWLPICISDYIFILARPKLAKLAFARNGPLSRAIHNGKRRRRRRAKNTSQKHATHFEIKFQQGRIRFEISRLPNFLTLIFPAAQNNKNLFVYAAPD